jgi:phage major head subunit gpT-like protein
MSMVTSDFLAGLLTNFRAIFKQSLDEAFAEQNLFDLIATRFDSTSDKESYGWLGSNPTMSEWTDTRIYKAIKAYDYTLTNKHYEGTIAVNRDTMEDDKYNLIRPRIQGLARRALRHWNQMVGTQLDDGASLTAFDGVAFFSATHQAIGASGVFANRLNGAYSASAANILSGIGAAYAAMANFKDDKGVPMGLVADTIVCSPAMKLPILNALLPAVAGTVRPEASLIPPDKVIATPWIDADADDYYVLCTKSEVKPIIFQLRKSPEFVGIENPDAEHVFKYNEFLYGVDDRFAVGYGDPRTAIMVHTS